MLSKQTKDEIIFSYINKMIQDFTEMKSLCQYPSTDLMPLNLEKLFKSLSDLYEVYWHKTKVQDY